MRAFFFSNRHPGFYYTTNNGVAELTKTQIFLAMKMLYHKLVLFGQWLTKWLHQRLFVSFTRCWKYVVCVPWSALLVTTKIKYFGELFLDERCALLRVFKWLIWSTCTYKCYRLIPLRSPHIAFKKYTPNYLVVVVCSAHSVGVLDWWVSSSDWKIKADVIVDSLHSVLPLSYD